jgi:hypothetical protein
MQAAATCIYFLMFKSRCYNTNLSIAIPQVRDYEFIVKTVAIVKFNIFDSPDDI